MLNKECLLGKVNNLVPAKLTIGSRSSLVSKYVGYAKIDNRGDLSPKVINGITINDIRVENRADHTVSATLPFFYEGTKYKDGDSSESLCNKWVPLVGQTVTVYFDIGRGGNTYSYKVFERILQKFWRILTC